MLIRTAKLIPSALHHVGVDPLGDAWDNEMKQPDEVDPVLRALVEYAADYYTARLFFGGDMTSFNAETETRKEKMKPASYPFLAIARKYGLDYGDVLLYAEFDRIQISLGFERAQVTNRYANAINKIRTNSDYDIIDREILLSNDQFRAIQRGEIDWLSGGRITAHDELDFTEELPIGALNYVLFDKSLDDGTNDMSNREIDLNDESDGIPGDNI